MIAALIVYGIAVSALVAIGAFAAEWVARRLAIPARIVWAVAMAATLGFIALAPFRGTSATGPALRVSGVEVQRGASATASAFSLAGLATRATDIERALLVEPIERSIAFIQGRFPAAAGTYLIALWLVASVSLVLLMVVIHLRFVRDRREWPLAKLFGVDVRIAPEAGPAVIGVVRPDIVVPRWLLGRSDDEQRLVIAHEAEHLRAFDPVLLVFGWTVAAILPWNPAAWWMLSRLRLAVELDCDSRVLSAGVAPRKYGDLLIDLAEQRSGFRVSVAALADDSSHLEQRLIAMKPDLPKYIRARSVILGAFALTAVLVACETAMPTATDVNKMDAESAELAATRASLLKAKDTATVYTLDGVVVTAAQAKAVSADKIASVDVVGSADKKAAEIRIVTASQAGRVTAYKLNAATSAAQKMKALILIDGVKATQQSYEALDPNKIASVRVTKGAAASKYYDPLAANGVIEITTKPKS